MKKIELFEKAIREQAPSLKEREINGTLFWAYRNSIESENVGVFALISAGPFQFQRSEIDEVRFFSRADLTAHRADFTPNLCVELDELHNRGIF